MKYILKEPDEAVFEEKRVQADDEPDENRQPNVAAASVVEDIPPQKEVSV